ncbi:MAG: YchJ family protein [Rhizobiales bacterium]|nr:YchJ family protein [Hyphomicrobiales bacterium]
MSDFPDFKETDACPCGSGKTFGDCCAPYLAGSALPPSPEALMRSRYSAFATHNIDYLESTLLPGTRDDFDRDGVREWAEGATWTGLEVRHTEAGGPMDQTGVVEFIAHFSMQGEPRLHHETSSFVRQDGRWWYVDGIMGARPRKVEKIGRNDPCSCGSGKKYKKCCGQAA